MKTEKYIIHDWMDCVMGRISADEFWAKVQRNFPSMVSCIFTRKCNLRCKHCIFPVASKEDLALENLEWVDQAIAAIYGVGVRKLLHIGRTLQREHLPILKKWQERGMQVGLIDNGSTFWFLRDFLDFGLILDWLDVSADGWEGNHEKQRGKNSWKPVELMLEGYSQFAKSIAVLGTVSTVNLDTIVPDLMTIHRRYPFAEIFLSTTTPSRFHTNRMTLSEDEMQQLIDQLLTWSEYLPLKIRFFTLKDFRICFEALKKIGAEAKAKFVSFHFEVDKMEFAFIPESLLALEEFAIDANGRHILPFGVDWHLAERPDDWQMSDDLILTDPDESHCQLVQKYRKVLGEKALEEEKRLFADFFA